MRLTEYEIKSIKESFEKYFADGDVYLFGSRVDDTQKGGDIDLFIDTPLQGDLQERKTGFLLDLESKIGEQKIDVVISKDKRRPIEQEALKRRIKLDLQKLKQQKVIRECDKHLQRLEFAKEQVKSLFPLDENSYLQLSDEDIQAIDQLLYRFSKLQDTVGEKLIKIVFSLYEENVEKYTFIDMLNRLEKAEILSVENWKKLRIIRNELSHNYDDDPEQSSRVINTIYMRTELLKKIYLNIKNRIDS